MLKRLWVPLILILCATFGVACDTLAPQVAFIPPGPRSWIDSPLDKSTIPLGPIAIMSHSADPLKIVTVELSVNGAAVRSDPNPDGTSTLVTMSQEWTPAAPGDYTLQVRAQNSASSWGDYASKVVTVAGAAAPVKPALPPAPLPAVSSPLPIAPPTLAVAPSALPAVGIAFNADRISLVQGQCTTLRWQVTNASQVFLDNASVNPSGSKQDCPTQNATHTLRVITLDKQTVLRTVTLNVVVPTRTVAPPPPPQNGCSGTPNIASFSASPSSISAGGSATLSWSAVTNANAVEIDQGIGGVPAPGSTSVSPGGTTTYTLTAHCGNSAASKQVTVSVTGAPPPPPPQPPSFGNASWDQPKFYFNSGKCGTRQVTISVSSPNASSMQIYFRAADQDAGASTVWTLLPMSNGGTWSRTISDTDIPGMTTLTKKWFQFYFSATNASGQTQSQQYLNSVELWYCSGIG